MFAMCDSWHKQQVDELEKNAMIDELKDLSSQLERDVKTSRRREESQLQARGPSQYPTALVVQNGSENVDGRLWLVDLHQAGHSEWVKARGITLAIKTNGKESRVVRYPKGVDVVEFPIFHKRGRPFQKQIALTELKKVLEKRQNAMIHCNGSFHRGPVAAATVLSTLTGVRFDKVLDLIRHVRKISDEPKIAYNMYKMATVRAGSFVDAVWFSGPVRFAGPVRFTRFAWFTGSRGSAQIRNCHEIGRHKSCGDADQCILHRISVLIIS